MIDKSDGRLFILHNREPRLLAEVHHFEDLSENQILSIQMDWAVYQRLDYHPETIFFVPIWFDDIELQKTDVSILTDKMTGALRRMADWYKAYLIWEDSQDE
jgi:hypothetical protein